MNLRCCCCCCCPQNKVVFDRMRSTALDMLTPGYDPRSGFGFVAGNTLLVSITGYVSALSR
jgi:hypothetical protein